MMMPHPALAATHDAVWRVEPRRVAERLTRAQGVRAATSTPHLLLNAPLVAARLGYPELSGLDLLELFAFVWPARFAVPSAAGLADALGLPPPGANSGEAAFLGVAAARLLDTLGDPAWEARAGAYADAQALARARWPWAAHVTAQLAKPDAAERGLFDALPRWEDMPPRARPRTVALADGEVLAGLAGLLGEGAEDRGGQRDYALAANHAFGPRDVPGQPRLMLAEAGTGIGKTLGYLAPAALWAERSGGAVWVSTYTKALQRQLARESARVFADGALRIVVRKGRENYLCLLNLEDAAQGAFTGRAAIFALLVQRWARFSKDGDMVGGDLPGWLPGLFGRKALGALTDRRGECVRAGCPHYRSCFIERSARASAEASIVIANHALVMANAVRGRAEGRELTRIVFDEGHHLFDAADGAFALALTGREGVELGHWLLGPSRATRGRRRGLAARLADAASYDEGAGAALRDCLAAAAQLASEGWLGRVIEGAPQGPIELLLGAVRDTVLARAEPGDEGHGLETEAAHLPPALIEAAAAASAALSRLRAPMAALEARLGAVIEGAPDWLDTQGRARIEAAAAGLRLRGGLVSAWTELLERLGGPPDPLFVDWLALERAGGREYDVGVRRHWLDPTKPFAEAVLAPAHGALITSATLRARGAALTGADDWRDTEHRTGATHLALPPGRFAVESPFDYAAQARVLVVTDVDRRNPASLAGAFAALIEASGGGALGLFTAIARLRAVHARIADGLAGKGLAVLAQHVDPIDTGTLVDLFRADAHASLLGSDALRDGVDVPGEALRLIVMEGVPWPRRTVLHAARKAAFGGAGYDDLIIQGRIAQAFGRLIRRANDRGVFVILGSAVPTRLLAGLPPGVAVERVPLADARAIVRGFVGPGLVNGGRPSNGECDASPEPAAPRQIELGR